MPVAPWPKVIEGLVAFEDADPGPKHEPEGRVCGVSWVFVPIILSKSVLTSIAQVSCDCATDVDGIAYQDMAALRSGSLWVAPSLLPV